MKAAPRRAEVAGTREADQRCRGDDGGPGRPAGRPPGAVKSRKREYDDYENETYLVLTQ